MNADKKSASIRVYLRFVSGMIRIIDRILRQVSNESPRKKSRDRVHARPRCSPDPNCYQETRTSIFFGCASGSFWIVTCSTPLVSSAVMVSGSTVSGSDTLRETLP